MRRLLGVLRRDDELPALAPQPSLGRAEELVADAREDGMEVALGVEGTPHPLSRGVDLAAHRVLQEALEAAAAEPALTRADVSLGYGQDQVTVAVSLHTSAESRPLDSDQIAALRDRVTLYGGSLRAGRLPDSPGFRMTAWLPLEVAA